MRPDDHDHDDSPETKVYPDDVRPEKVTYEGYVEAGLLDLPPIDEDEDVLVEPSIVDDDHDDEAPPPPPNP